MSNINQSDVFKRQITLLEIGKEGQQKLQDAKVLVVGCGGLGSPIAVYLASSGIGKIHLVDFDHVDVTNLHRQVFYSLEDIGNYKSECLATFIQQRAPFTEVSFSTEAITKTNALYLVADFDIVVDGTDSLPTKYLLNDACVMKQKPLVYGSLYKFDGYVSTFNVLQKDGTFSANLRDAFPEMATDVPNCEEAGTLNAIVGMIATSQVNEVLKIVAGIGKPLVNELLIYNALENSQLKMKLKKTVFKQDIEQIFDQESYYDTSCEVQNPEWLISSKELKAKIGDSNLELIAVLSNLQLPFKVNKTIPIDKFNVDNIHIDASKTYIMICQKGVNSYKAVKLVKVKYPEINVLSLDGGISAY